MAGYSQKNQFIGIDDNQLDTCIISPQTDSAGTVLFLHGGGATSTKELYLPMAKALAGRGYKCLVFSYPGHGKSSGEIAGSSLAERAEIATKLAKELDFLPLSMICASSMGAHIAMRMLDKMDVDKLVLFVPAIYSDKAENVPFGPSFTQILRTPGSYKDSLALESLRGYKGKLAIFQAGKDRIIPPEVIDLIWRSAINISVKDKIVYKDSPHGITDWIYQSRKRFDNVVKALDTFNFSALKENA